MKHKTSHLFDKWVNKKRKVNYNNKKKHINYINNKMKSKFKTDRIEK